MAKVVIANVMQSPRVQEAAQDSVRDVVRKEVAQGLAAQILSSARTRTEVNKDKLDDMGMLTRVIIRSALEKCCIYTSSDYVQALTRFTILMCLKGAASLMVSQDHLRQANFNLEKDTQRSLPTPIVFLHAEQSWGQWLTPTSK